jgi:hypothetical protein
VASLPLPSGASTETTLSALNTKIPSSLTVTSTRLLVDPSEVTSPISAASLPLPTGAATESTLSTLNGKVPANLTVSSTRLLVDGSGVTQPVSGTVTANTGTTSTTGNLGSLNATLDIALSGQSVYAVDVRGTFSGTITFQSYVDGTGITTAIAVPAGSGNSFGSVTTTTTTGTWYVLAPGAASGRVTMTSYTSGTANITLRAVTGGVTYTLGAANQSVQGVAGRGSSIVGNQVMIAGRGATAAPTAVTNGQVVDPLMTVQGHQVVRPWQIPELCWSYAAASGGITNTSDVAIASAAGAGLRRYITSIQLSNNSATATEVVVKDGASTVIARHQLPANAGNINHRYEPPLATTANTALNVACITTGTATYVNAQGFTAP